MTKKTHILIVDDDKEIRTLVADLLKQYSYETSEARDGVEMFRILEKKTIDLIILDVMLPGEDGFALCRKLRSKNHIPIIMLTAVGTETDRIIGLELGADDYLAKPFNPRELVARVKAILRRTNECEDTSHDHEKKSARLTFNNWVLDLDARRLFNHENMEITLSSGEYDLLVTFLEHPKRVLSRDQLMDLTRHRNMGPFDRSIDVQISRLRQKIEPDSKNPTLIKTVRNGGYIFTTDVKRS